MLMKNVTRKATCLLGMMMLLFGTHAYAQESIKVEGADIVVANVQTVQAEDVSGVAYSGLTADFDTTAVNTALGIDSIAMATAYIVNLGGRGKHHRWLAQWCRRCLRMGRNHGRDTRLLREDFDTFLRAGGLPGCPR